MITNKLTLLPWIINLDKKIEFVIKTMTFEVVWEWE